MLMILEVWGYRYKDVGLLESWMNDMRDPKNYNEDIKRLDYFRD